MRFLFHVRRYYFGNDNYTFTNIKCYCDNGGVVINEAGFPEKHWTPTNSTRPDYDMLKQLHLAVDECPISMTFQHIKGHENRNTTYDLLDRPSQLNVLAVMYATDHRMLLEHTHGQGQAPEIPLPSANAQLRHADGIITGKEKYWLRTKWPLTQLQMYLQDNFQWTAKELATIDWNILAAARKATIPSIRQFMTFLL